MAKKDRYFFLFFVSLFSFSPLIFYGDSAYPILARLASPEMEGRGVGTRGLDLAHDYLLDSLRKVGLEPTSQSLRVFVGNQLGEKNYLRLAPSAATAVSAATNISAASTDRENSSSMNRDNLEKSSPQSSEFLPLAFSRSGLAKANGFAFAGYGISLRNAGDAIYDDYAGIDVKDKIVLVMSGDPGIGAPQSIFRNPSFYQYATPIYKVQNAILHGALGVVFIRDPLSLGGKPEAPLAFQERQGGGTTMDIIAGQATLALAERLMGQAILPLQAAIRDTQAPKSLMLDKPLEMAVELKRQVGEVKNIAVLIPGSEPSLANEVVVIGAHYDHLGFGGDSSLDPEAQGEVHPGADDNASGVQGVFDLALRTKKAAMNRRPVLFAFFTAEEIGLLGSKHFVENSLLPKEAKVISMLNLDMIGRMRDRKLTVIGGNTALEFSPLVERVNSIVGLELQTMDEGFGSSDHASFLQQKIPSLFFTTGAHADYHRASDTAEKINQAGLELVTDFAWRIWQELDQAAAAPTYDPRWEENLPPPRPGKGYGVYFGSVPEFNQGQVAGVLLQGVRTGSPAAEAGLQAGDILQELGEIQIKNLYDLVFALRYYRPGDEVVVVWQRQGQRQQAKAILRARDPAGR